MAQQGVLWQLVSGFDPFGAYNRGQQQHTQQQNILQQLAGQEQDRSLRRDEAQRNQQNTDRSFGFQQSQAERQAQQFQQQFGFTQSEAQRAQANADRNFAIAAMQARGDDLKEIKNADGSSSWVRIPRDPSQPPTPINVPGTNQPPRNPYAPLGKVTDEQAKAALYANRMADSNDIISKLQSINQGPMGMIGGTITNLAPAATNSVQSPDRQMFLQAQRDFINAVLRRESGAVISESEFANARQQYFPQPGDSEQVLQQKAANRLNAIRGIMGAAGQNYTPPKNYQTPPPQQNQTKTQISSQAEYERLPSGSLFIMNGKSYQKP
jgi:hypothetical protein